MDFKNKIVLVTGGAKGIGKAIVKSFLERGAKVSICDVDVEEGTKTLKEFKKKFGESNVIFSKCDVSNGEEFEAAFNECEKHFKGFDILINNAGIINKDLKKTQAVNFEGPVKGTELAIDKMGKHNGGKGGFVVNISSFAALTPVGITPYYSSVKAGLIHFSRMMGGKLHHDYHGVSILCLCPGSVNTVLNTGDTIERTIYNKYVAEALPKFRGNLTNMTEPEEVAEAVIRMINENKTGEVAIIDRITGFMYVPPSLDKDAMGLGDF